MSGISAQGSTLRIATGTGGAKTITAISAGFPAIVTSAAHGLNNGDVVVLAGIVGASASLLNGTTRVVSNKTASTFALLDADTTGLTYTSGGTATPNTYTKINGLTSFDGFDGTADELDVTDLDSTAKEFISGIKDEGKFGFEAKTLKADAGQIALRANRTSGAVVGMVLTLPDASVATFNVIVKSMPTSGGVNAVLKGKIDTRISGPVVWS
ncbi:phage tail tube protein [Massilia sp. DWR3-1-1]|uniref:phage tail tube protein n=1 Tax=Massilia sp. DWR3-1-1 TaxID=2804559 RepID=UPI003CE6DD91